MGCTMTWRNFPNAPAPGAVLIASAALAEGAAVPVALGEKPRLYRIVVTRTDGVARAYVNLCPHFRIPLAMDGRDLTVSDGYIWCGFHSAQFRQHDGHCVDGPAKGATLTPIPVVEAGGVIAIAAAAPSVASSDETERSPS